LRKGCAFSDHRDEQERRKEESPCDARDLNELDKPETDVMSRGCSGRQSSSRLQGGSLEPGHSNQISDLLDAVLQAAPDVVVRTIIDRASPLVKEAKIEQVEPADISGTVPQEAT
jgi:hypothetical protein